MRLAQSKVHFVGIGGIGMSGLAELLHNMGAGVSGSDLSENAQIERLTDIGVKVFKGHRKGQLEEADVVVFSSAIPRNNPELEEARDKKIPIIPRAEVLAEIMRLKRGIALAGTHGKTTMTSMTAAIFIHARMDPTVAVGGRLDLIKSTALLGQGRWLIAEADESDGSFMRLSPEIAVISNIDNDHLDHYGNFENLKRTYVDFAQLVPFYGSAIVFGDDPDVRELFADYDKKLIYYGFGENNDYRVAGQKGSYTVIRNQEVLGEFHLKIPGKHNALNALASIIAGIEAGLDFSTCVEGIGKFEGVDRRMHFKGEAKGIQVYDDYGHHPTEIQAVLKTFKEEFSDRRLVIAFQPHRYSRTRICWNQFLSSFDGADQVFVWDIYPASEDPIEGIHSRNLVEEIGSKSVLYAGSGDKAKQLVMQQLKEGDILLTLGAGNIFQIGEEIRNQLNGKS